MAKRTRGGPPFEARLFSWLLGFSAVGCVLGLEAPAAGPRNDRPPARDEAQTAMPKDCGAACRWSPGYWHWDGGGYVWVAGRWEREPR